MAAAGGDRSADLTRPALSVAIAAIGLLAFSSYVWWSGRGGVPTPDVSAVVLGSIAIGGAAGLISGRFIAAPASWLAACVGTTIGYQVAYGADPTLPAQHSSFTGHELQNWAFLMVFVGGGHLLGAWARKTDRRGLAAAAIACLATCGSSGVGLWQLRPGEPSLDTAQVTGWFLLISMILTGAIAGFVSRRGRDAITSWAAGVIGFMLAFLVVLGIDEGIAEPMEVLAYYPITLLPFIAGGHVLGVALSSLMRRAIPRSPEP